MTVQVTAQHLINTGRTPGSILMEAYLQSPHQTPAWLNLGYWSPGFSYQMACQNLADAVAQLADLKNCANIVDAGSGFAAPAIHWAQQYPHLSMSCLNVFAKQIDQAQIYIQRSNLAKRITQILASATKMPFADGTFDAVIALESAFHFNTRADFFNEAYRVLRPGGVLALADMLPYTGVLLDEAGYSNLRQYGIAEENLTDCSDYINQLSRAGFKVEHSESIRSSVYPYFYSFICKLSGGANIRGKIVPTPLDHERAYAVWRRIYCLDDFILIRATRRER